MNPKIGSDEKISMAESEKNIVANREFILQNGDKENWATALISAETSHDIQNDEKEKEAAELCIATDKLVFQIRENEKWAAELFVAHNELRKKEKSLLGYVEGMKVMMFMTSHRVRQPIAHILGISELLYNSRYSPDQMKLLAYLKESALSLDDYTKELTAFMVDLNQNEENNISE